MDGIGGCKISFVRRLVIGTWRWDSGNTNIVLGGGYSFCAYNRYPEALGQWEIGNEKRGAIRTLYSAGCGHSFLFANRYPDHSVAFGAIIVRA